VSIDPRAIALQGLLAPLSPLALAVQGLAQAIAADAAQLARVLRIGADPRDARHAQAGTRSSTSSAGLRAAVALASARAAQATRQGGGAAIGAASRVERAAAQRQHTEPASPRRVSAELSAPQSIAAADRAAIAPPRASTARATP
jgi:hypothetical protein